MRIIFLALFFCLSCTSISKLTEPHKSGIIIAHRGASYFLPEHTLESYAYAHAKGVDFIEADVVLTKDDIPICLHDVILDPTTNVEEIYPNRKRKDGHWYAIDFNLSEIKKLKVHERTHNKKQVFPNRFPYLKSDFRVPTFQEFIELIQGLNETTRNKIGIYPEIKKPEFHEQSGKNSKEIIYQMIKKYGYEKNPKQIYIQSFHPETLKYINKKESTIPLIQLIGDNEWGDSSTDFDLLKKNAGLSHIKTYASGIGVWLNHIEKDSTLVYRSKKIGLLVHAYTHRPETSKKTQNTYFEKLSLDGIFSDTPYLK